MRDFPQKFCDRLREIIPDEEADSVLSSLRQKEKIAVRVNTLRISGTQAWNILREAGISFQEIPSIKNAFWMDSKDMEKEILSDAFHQGWFYRQSISSMLASLILNPQPQDRVLDLCAAPGSKATQMAALMNNTGQIVAIEKVKSRFYKLQTVCRQMGVENIKFKCMDARHFRPQEGLFDKVLADVPCSCEGRFQKEHPKTYAYWSLRKIKEMKRKQKGLLLSAGRCLKPGGHIVYSTCTFAPEENEAVVDWFLKKTEGCFELKPISIKGIKTYGPLSHWKNKSFGDQIAYSLRILPDDYGDAFFMAKFIKIEKKLIKQERQRWIPSPQYFKP